MDVLKLKEIRLAVLFRNSGSNGDSRVEKRDLLYRLSVPKQQVNMDALSYIWMRAIKSKAEELDE